MSAISDFLRQTVITGLLILLPVLVIIKLLAGLVTAARGLASPFLKFLPQQLLAHPLFPIAFALVIVVLVCLILGLLTRLAFARSVGRWIERHIFNNVPAYLFVKHFLGGFGDSDTEGFKPAALHARDGSVSFAYLIESHEEDLVTVMIPSAPSAMTGSVQVVPRERVSLLQTRNSSIARVLAQRGAGSLELLRKEKTSLKNAEDKRGQLGG